MRIRFSKMHGAGNDFVVFDGVRQSVRLTAERVRAIADRHFGVGCDQVLLVEAARSPQADFRYRIFNADGGEVEQCGNGARCFVRFVHDQGLSAKKQIRVETLSGIIAPRIEDDGQVTVDMGAPVFEPGQVPFQAAADSMVHDLEVEGEVGEGVVHIPVSVLSMGNPHAVQFVADLERAPVSKQGPLIERHARFPKRVNAGYVQVLQRHHIALRVWERGAGETLACGTGACAAAVAGIRRGLLDSPVRVTTRGGDLIIRWQGMERVNSGDTAAAAPAAPATSAVFMTGPAQTVFEGELEFND